MARRKKEINDQLDINLPGVELESEGKFQPAQSRLVEPEKKKVGKFNISAHYVDQVLIGHENQLTLWDEIDKATQMAITDKTVGVEIAPVKGIPLSSAEGKLIECLAKMLYHRWDAEGTIKNQTPIRYAGGFEYEPKLSFTLYELAKEYSGSSKVSGKEMTIVKDIIETLIKKDFYITYKTEPTTNKGIETRQTISEYDRLIKLRNISEVKFMDGEEISSRKDIEVSLHPIFVHQINTKWVRFPDDLHYRMAEAYGNKNVPNSVGLLIKYLQREMSNSRFKTEIRLTLLLKKIAEPYMSEGRRSKALEYANKAIEVAEKMGIISSYTLKPGKTGELKYTFKLNKDWAE